MSFKFEISISNYRDDDFFVHSEIIKEHTTIGLIAVQKNAIERYYEKYPEADDKKFLKIKSKISYVE